MPVKNLKSRVEFGDFQTPDELAKEICAQLRAPFSPPSFNGGRGGVPLVPRSLVEPTCGVGSFLHAALESFSSLERAVGHDINAEYVEQTKSRLSVSQRKRTKLATRSFFDTDWKEILDGLPEPILVLGNPPWVTNAGLGVLGSGNLPQKKNAQKLRGLDARTGKSNFDISEWMLLRLLEALQGRDAYLAMLCKTSVARKVLAHAWKNELCIENASLHVVDAKKHFNAATGACLLRAGPFKLRETTARIYAELKAVEPASTLGFRDGSLVCDIGAYEKWRNVLIAVRPLPLPPPVRGGETTASRSQGATSGGWRSGIKHDCARVMEFTRENDWYVNGLGEQVDLEDECLFPLVKSSDLAQGRKPRRYLLVTQRSTGEDTAGLKKVAPKTWKYLQRHAALLDRRASSIYRGRPRFSIFGIGPYSFAPWKVAISGLYKTLRFSVLGSFGGKPVVLDDTCYFLPCKSHAEATALCEDLNSPEASEALRALIFWDAKRPVTVDLLARLNLEALRRARTAVIRQ
jgi:hypothetical protein